MTVTRKPKRMFSPQQKFEIVQDIQHNFPLIKDGLAKYQINSALYNKWKRQLEVGIRSSLRNSKMPKDRLLQDIEKENKLLKEMILNLTLTVVELKKTLSLN